MSFAALQAAVRRLTHALGVRTEPYRVLSRQAVARQLDRSGFRNPVHPPSVFSAHRVPQSDRIPALHGGFGRPLPQVGSGAPVRDTGNTRRGTVQLARLVTGATGFTGGQLARAIGCIGYRVRALVRGRSALLRYGRKGLNRFLAICATDRARPGPSKARTSFTTSPPSTGRQAGRAETYRARQRHGRCRAHRAGRRGPAFAGSCSAAPSASTATSSTRRPTKMRAAQARRHLPADEARRRGTGAGDGGAVGHRDHHCPGRAASTVQAIDGS